LLEGQSRSIAGRRQLCFKGEVSMFILSFRTSTIFLVRTAETVVRQDNPSSRENGFMILLAGSKATLDFIVPTSKPLKAGLWVIR